MKLTPLDIQQQKFQVKWRGYDKQEVETFLEMISEDAEALLQECNKLKKEIQKCETQLLDFRENERAIQQTIMTTQKVSDDLKRNAQREAELIISEAKVAAGRIMNDARAQAEKVVGDSRSEVGQLTKELHDLKNRKMDYEVSFRSILESQLHLLQSAQEDRE